MVAVVEPRVYMCIWYMNEGIQLKAMSMMGLSADEHTVQLSCQELGLSRIPVHDNIIREYPLHRVDPDI